MPGYKGHLVGGSVAFIIVLVCLGQARNPSFFTMMEWLGFALAGSLFPDIDVKSKGQKYFYWIIFFAIVYLACKQRTDTLILVSLLSIVPMLVKHRGLFHRAWFLILMPLALWYIIGMQCPGLHARLLYDVLFFIIGALSHLYLDVGLRRMFRW